MLKKTLINLCAFLMFINFLSGQDIISNAFNSTLINYGDATRITFNVNKISLCDSYFITTEVDHLFKSIKIKIDYNYNSFCDESVFTDFEMVEVVPLLEGFYSTSIELSVPTDFSRNETITLFSVFVSNPFPDLCNNPFIFSSFSQVCPAVTTPVCACDGQNYNNECEAFFENENGAYYNFVCGQHVQQNSFEFECGTFNLRETDVFEKYDCSSDFYPGSELYLRYTYIREEEPTVIRFRSNEISTRLFLVSIVDDNLNCIAMSDGEKLTFENVNSGEYIIIADGESSFSNVWVELCEEDIPTTSTNELADSMIDIYPNPSNEFIKIHSNGIGLQSAVFYNTMGQVVLNTIIDNTNEIKHNLQKGIYQIVIITQDNQKIAKKIIVL